MRRKRKKRIHHELVYSTQKGHGVGESIAMVGYRSPPQHFANLMTLQNASD
jgi:hypothetical protein